MKSCPHCHRIYSDDTLNYCLEDGERLGTQPYRPEPETAIISSSGQGEPPPISYGGPASISSATSIAVLPFVNMSADAENEFFCDGLAEELLNALTKINDLKVAARTSTFSFKGRNVSMSEIGQTLGVRTVLEGSVRKAGSRVRITAQLINASDGYHLWSERYDRELKDIFDVQEEITLSIVETLKVKLLGGEKAAMLKRHTVDTEAYELYLRGRFLWNKRTSESIKAAIESFKASAERDPEYALAHVGLADSYSMLEQYSGAPASDVVPLARAAAERALELDDSIAEAHASLGMIELKSWNWAASASAFERSFEINPNYPTSHHWYSILLKALGKWNDALAEISRAHALDPLSYPINGNMALTHLKLGGLAEAESICQKMTAHDPTYGDSFHYLGFIQIERAQFPQAVESIEHAAALKQRSSEILGSLGYVYGLAGEAEKARAVIEELKQRYLGHNAIGQNLAAVYVGLGDMDSAFNWLERDFEAHSGVLAFIRWFPSFRSLSTDYRFEDLLQRMNLPT